MPTTKRLVTSTVVRQAPDPQVAEDAQLKSLAEDVGGFPSPSRCLKAHPDLLTGDIDCKKFSRVDDFVKNG